MDINSVHEVIFTISFFVNNDWPDGPRCTCSRELFLFDYCVTNLGILRYNLCSYTLIDLKIDKYHTVTIITFTF